GVDRRSCVTKKPHRRCKGMNRPWLVAALLVSGCASASPATQGSSPTPTQATATPVAQRFVDVPPAVTKLASAYGDPWAQVVAFHEVGLRPGESVSYTVRGTATVNYACNSTTAFAQVNQQVVTGPVGATKSFVADAGGEIANVIAAAPPPPPDASCPPGYAIDIWRKRSAMRKSYPELVDELFATPGVPPCVVVLVDCWTSVGGSQFLDSPGTGKYHSYLCNEIVPWIDQHYRTMAQAEHRGIAGKSSGGYGAMVTPMLRPDLFSGLATHAGDALFEVCYQPGFPTSARLLRDKHG